MQEAADVPGQRADVHRRRVGLAELTALGVEDARAEVLGLADDRGVAHPEEDAGHLLGDRVEGAAEHSQRDRVDLDALALGRPWMPARPRIRERTRLFLPRQRRGGGGDRLRLGGRADVDDDVSEAVDVSGDPGRDHGRRVVLGDDRGAREAVAGLQQRPVVVAGGDLLQLSVDPEPGVALVAQPRRRRLVAGLDLRASAARASARCRARARWGSRCRIPRTAASTPARGCRGSRSAPSDPGFVDVARRGIDAELVALAEVAAVDDALDEDAIGGNAVLLELGAGLALQVLEHPLQRRPVELRHALIGRRDVLVDRVGREQPHRRGDARVGRHEHPGRPDLERDVRGEQRAGAALGDQCEVARVVALADGVLLDRLHHRVGEDLDGPHRGLLDRHVERRTGPSSYAVRARSARSSISPPRRPRATASRGSPSRRRPSARPAPPVSRRARIGAGRARPYAVDPAGIDVRDRAAPAPIVSTSTIGIIAWYGPTFVSSRCFMRRRPCWARPMSAEVPPTSSVMTLS